MNNENYSGALFKPLKKLYMRYSVELRKYTEDGEDYIEDHYEFSTKTECIKFAIKNANYVYSVLDYEDRNYDPVELKY